MKLFFILVTLHLFFISSLLAEEKKDNPMDLFLKAEATADTELRVRVRGGRVQTGSATIEIPDQKSGLFDEASLGAGESRIDLVYLTIAGVVSIQKGTAAINPSVPAYDGKSVIAEVTITDGDTNISSSAIKDVRNQLSLNLLEITAYLESLVSLSFNASIEAGSYKANSIDENDIRLNSLGWLKAVDIAGTGTVNLIRSHASEDIPVINTLARMSTTEIPVHPAGIANKRYVDDQIAAIGSLLGSWTSAAISSGTVTQETSSDVLLVITLDVTNADFSFYTDGNSSPSSRKARYRPSNDTVNTDAWNTITVLVKKDDYWKIVTTMSGTVWKIPLGS